MNSMENLKTAVEWQADQVEIDLRIFQGVLYLSHDPIRKDCLQKYLTLQEAVKFLRKNTVELNCDLKEKETLEPAMSVLWEAGMADRVFFTGEVNADLVRRPFRYFQNVENCGIVQEGELLTETTAKKLADWYDTYHNDTLAGFNIEYRTLTEKTLSIFLQHQIPICCWQVDEELCLQKLVRAGVKYITTNNLRLSLQIKKQQVDGCTNDLLEKESISFTPQPSGNDHIDRSQTN